MTDHACQYRRDDTGWSARLADWVFPILHLLGTVTITSSLLLFVDGRIFPVGDGDFFNVKNQGKAFSLLNQPAITSIISLALVFHRLAGGGWLTLAGWRMAFTVLELNGASLNDLGRMINYRCPPFKPPKRIFTPQEALLLPTLWVIFLLATPSLFTNPLLTGAVNWIPTHLYLDTGVVIKIPEPGPSRGWNEHNMWENNRVYEVYGAVGLASTADSLDFNLSVLPTYRRFLPWLPSMPPNSTLSSVTIPVFHVNDFQPFRHKSEIPGDFDLIEQVILDRSNPVQNFSTIDNMFSGGSDVGRVTIVHTETWRAPEPVGKADGITPGNDLLYEYPAPTIKTERKVVIVATEFDHLCNSTYNSKFGAYSDFYTYEFDNHGDTDLIPKSCYVFFDLNYTAGSTTCKDCKVQTNGLTPGGMVQINDTSAHIQPDSLVETAIAMMPDVLFYTEIANSSFAPTFNNLEGYTRGMLSTAYQASWNSLARSFLNDSFTNTRYQRPVPGLVANLSKERITAWCILNILVTVSAVLLHIVQRRCGFKAIVTPWLSALLLDASAVTTHDSTGLCNAREVDKQDESMLLRLVCRNDGEGQDAYRHPLLMAEAVTDKSAFYPLAGHEMVGKRIPRLNKGLYQELDDFTES